MNRDDVIAGRYRLESKLGEGGLGVVWSARDTTASEEPLVAIKFLHDEPRARARFGREVQALQRLSHPHCVAIFDHGSTANGSLYLVMEYLEGETLTELVGQLDLVRATNVMQQMTDALAYAHGLGIVHRDLKPDNIMVQQRGGADVVKVLDFGIAKIAGPEQQDITKTHEVVGTPTYMSPEQFRGARDVDASADVYSLGVVFYHVLAGRPPFDGAPLAVALQHLKETPPALVDAPPHLGALVQAMLDKEPARRPTTRAVVEALAGDMSSISASAPRPRPFSTDLPVAARRSGGPSPLQILAVLGVAIIVLASVAIFLWAREPTKEPAPIIVRDHARVGGLLGEPEALSPEPTRRPSSEPDAGPPDGGTVLCPPPPFTHTGTVRASHEGHTFDVEVVLPYGYDRNRSYPLLVLLHSGAENGRAAIEGTGFGELTHERNFILAAPSNSGAFGASPQRFGETIGAIHHMREHFCVDATRVFAVGHAVGGNTLDRFACEAPEIRAIASLGQRWNEDQTACAKPVPNIYLSGLADGYNPANGGRSCSGSKLKLSLAEHERRWRTQNKCGSKRRKWLEYRNSTCWEWEGCEARFVSCHLHNGGHTWPNSVTPKPRLWEKTLRAKDCAGKPADFLYAETIWDFFVEVAPPAEGALDPG